MDGDKHPNAIFKGSSMIFEERVEDFSSLPQADSNSTLEERSSLALRNILPTEDWVVRDERIIDAGVDLSIELKINSRYTNLRAQVQLKSTEHPRDNGDGSISLSVAVSNLKYLLNGQSPIYILYIANRDELRFVWARDERLRLDNDNPDWEEQKEVSLRFCNYVTPQTLLTIKERISKECRLMAQTHESLLKASSGDLVRVCIDTETLNSTDPNRLLTLILEQGISLVNSGHAIDVRKAIDGLNPSAVSLPRVQLVLGYVYYFQTKFVAALAALAEALIGQSQLSAEDRAFLKHLKNTCSYRLGQISYDEYMKRQEMLGEEATDAFKASILFDTLDKNLKSCTTTADRRLCVNHILEEVMQTSHNTKLSEILKIQIYSFWLQSEGFQICVEEHDRWAKVKMRQLMEQPVDIQRELTEATDEWLRWNAAISVGLEWSSPLKVES